MPSEMYTITFGTGVIPIDLEGAKEVTFHVQGSNALHISTDEGIVNYFTLYPSGSAAPGVGYYGILTVQADDKRLWIKGAGAGIVQIWVVKR